MRIPRAERRLHPGQPGKCLPQDPTLAGLARGARAALQGILKFLYKEWAQYEVGIPRYIFDIERSSNWQRIDLQIHLLPLASNLH